MAYIVDGEGWCARRSLAGTFFQPCVSTLCRVRHAHQQQSGLSYIEVLIATVLIAITLVPAIEGLTSGIQGSALNKQRVEIHYALKGKLEQLLSESFEDLDAAATAAGAHTTATSYSDIFSPTMSRDVFIWRYDVVDADGDGNEFTGGEDNLLWISVALPDNSLSLQILVSRY